MMSRQFGNGRWKVRAGTTSFDEELPVFSPKNRVEKCRRVRRESGVSQRGKRHTAFLLSKWEFYAHCQQFFCFVVKQLIAVAFICHIVSYILDSCIMRDYATDQYASKAVRVRVSVCRPPYLESCSILLFVFNYPDFSSMLIRVYV